MGGMGSADVQPRHYSSNIGGSVMLGADHRPKQMGEQTTTGICSPISHQKLASSTKRSAASSRWGEPHRKRISGSLFGDITGFAAAGAGDRRDDAVLAEHSGVATGPELTVLTRTPRGSTPGRLARSLAAARAKVLSVEEIADLLDDCLGCSPGSRTALKMAKGLGRTAGGPV